MAYDLEEQEQLDSAKAFWEKYGTPLLSLLTVVLLVFAGYKGWQYWQSKQSAEAGAYYSELSASFAAKDIKKSEEIAGKIFANYKSSPYAELAAMTMAKMHMDAKDPAKAKLPLQWALENAIDDEFKHLARVRLAGVLLDQKAFDEALKLLATEPPASFATLYADRRGDIYLAQGNQDEARKQYKLALDKADDQAQIKPLIKLKLDALGGAAS
jgi:predicted negative regulator of RcsB-dependent stress response